MPFAPACSWRRALWSAAVAVFLAGALSSCVTSYPKETLPPPWIPENVEGSAEISGRPEDGAEAQIYYSETEKPVIDGEFGEWAGLEEAVTRVTVYGGGHNPEDAQGAFILRTDGVHLYVHARVADDLPHENFLPGSLAWRGDTVEIYFGDQTNRRTKYSLSDNQIRIVPRSKSEPFDCDVVVNQRTVGEELLSHEGEILAAAGVYRETGYTVEASIPLVLLGIDGLRPGQKVGVDFQVNDADESERDRLIQWWGGTDTAYFDPSVWGVGRVVGLPAGAGE